MTNLTFNPKDWPQGARAIVRIPGQSRLADVLVLQWSPSAAYVRLQVEPLGDTTNRIWREPDTDWELIERLKGSFGQ